MVAVNIPFTIPTIRPLDAFLLSLFAIVIAKAIRPIIAHKFIVAQSRQIIIVLYSLQILLFILALWPHLCYFAFIHELYLIGGYNHAYVVAILYR